MVGEGKRTVQKIIRKQKVAPLPAAVREKPVKKVKQVDPLIQKRPRNFGIGQAIQPKRDLTRFVKWPRYIRVQRQQAILYQRIKVPPPINQFKSCHLDRQTVTQLFRLLDKYRPESKKQKMSRLKAIAAKKAAGQEVVPQKRPNGVRFGVNEITTLVEQKKASLVAIAADVEPIEVVLHLPSLCRKMGVPYCIVKGGRSRLGQVVKRKSIAAIALTSVNPEDKPALSKLTETIKTNFNDRYDEVRKQWGGGLVSRRSRTKVVKLEKAKEKERSAKDQAV